MTHWMHRIGSWLKCFSLLIAAVVLSTFAGMPQQQLLNIGLALCLTGGLSDFGARFLVASNIAQANINDSGGFSNGAKLSFVIRDDATNAQQAVQVDTDLVNNVKVPAIMGHCSSGATIPASSVTIPAKVVLISPSATSPRITTLDDNDYVFRTDLSGMTDG